MLDARSEMNPFSDYSGPKCLLCLVFTMCGLVGDIDDLLLPVLNNPSNLMGMLYFKRYSIFSEVHILDLPFKKQT